MPKPLQSKRLKAREGSSKDIEHEPEPKPELSSSTSITKPQRNVRRGLRGALQSLPEMPLDILIEVLCRSRPLDLLHIARTTKAFRNLLMARSSAYIWKESRMNVEGLPEPFPGMSEPVFASLCFEPICTLCFKSGIQNVIWEFRARLCNSCKSTRTKNPLALLVDVDTVDFVLPHMSAHLSTKRIYGETLVLDSEVTEIMGAWKRQVDVEARTKFLEEGKARVKELEAHAARCRLWFSHTKTERAEEIEAMKRRRYEEVSRRLKEMGYEEDVLWVDKQRFLTDSVRLKMLPAVRQMQPLTERGWQKIQQEVVCHVMTKIRPRRLKSEYMESLRQRFVLYRQAMATFARPYRNVFPSTRELARLPDFKAILDPSVNKQEPTIDIYQALEPKIPDIVANWKAEVKEKLDEYLKNAMDDLPPDISLDNLVFAQMFRCHNCHSVFQNLDYLIAIHECRRRFPTAGGYYSQDSMYDSTLDILGMCVWKPSRFSTSSPSALRVLEACGKDRLATVQELDQLNPRFTCKKIDCQSLGTETIYNWRDAVAHVMRRAGYGEPSCELEVISSEKVLKLGPLDQAVERENENTVTLQRVWYCSHCEEHNKPKDDIVSHLKDIHGIDMPSDADLFPDPDRTVLNSIVYVVQDSYKERVELLTSPVLKALETGRAVFNDHL
ncbi:hypothetical protein QCA50_020948 [Cerrena zonata]|uniref:F-box domain-containing protein n=1 Tax=Cerrena zonata TaxID=2478898 RepID=A0AAW0F8F1_9APHY